MSEITTASEVIAALGGDSMVARIFGCTPPAVRNWRYGRGIPTAYRTRIDALLRRHGKMSAPSVYSGYKIYAALLPRPRRRSKAKALQ